MNIINFIIFYCAWFACVYGASSQQFYLGPLVVSFAVIINLLLSHSKRADFLLALICLAFGIIFESTISHTKFIYYIGFELSKPIAPLWVLSLWVNLSITLNHSLSWLKSHLILAGILGAISGPLSYAAGIKMGAASTENFWPFMTTLVVLWGIMVPILFLLARRLGAK